MILHHTILLGVERWKSNMANYFNHHNFTTPQYIGEVYTAGDILSELQNLCLFFPHAANTRKRQEWGHKELSGDPKGRRPMRC